MKHFIGFSIAIYLVLSILYFYKDDNKKKNFASSLKVYGTSSFIGSWGPGPKLKELFEKQSGLNLTFLEISDVSLLFQKISFEGEHALGDVVLGIDQYDIIRFANKIKWKEITSSENINFNTSLAEATENTNFLPYDWAPLSFVSRDDLKLKIEKLDDLLNSELKGKIALEDPRTSSAGVNFLSWIYKTKSASEAENFILQLFQQAHSFSPTWSSAYTLFKNKQVDLVLSYSTSPLYHMLEENNKNVRAHEFNEGHVIQVEFAGVPETCQNCDAAVKFVRFLQTPEAQKIIMEKNYMLPLSRSTQEGTSFDGIKIFKLLPMTFDSKEKVQNWINVWSEFRKTQ